MILRPDVAAGFLRDEFAEQFQIGERRAQVMRDLVQEGFFPFRLDQLLRLAPAEAQDEINPEESERNAGDENSETTC